MIITGLDKDYYLSWNDIYVSVKDFAKKTVYIDLTVTNETTGEILGTLRPYPNLNDEYKFNICTPVRALFPEPKGIRVSNSIQKMKIDFKVVYEDETTETTTVTKRFVRGGRNKMRSDVWNLEDGQPLLTAPFPRFVGVQELPMGVNKISGEEVIHYVPNDRVDVYRFNTCNPTYVRFLNSLGGFEWWVFEQRKDDNDGKAGKTKTSPTMSLKEHSMRQLATTQTRDIILSTEMPVEFYDLAVEMCNSLEIYIFDYGADQTDEEARFERVFLAGTNKIEKNTMSKKIKFDLKLTLPTYITREI